MGSFLVPVGGSNPAVGNRVRIGHAGIRKRKEKNKNKLGSGIGVLQNFHSLYSVFGCVFAKVLECLYVCHLKVLSILAISRRIFIVFPRRIG